MSLYIGRQFIVSFLTIFMILLTLILLVDMIELLRRAASKPQVNFAMVMEMALLEPWPFPFPKPWCMSILSKGQPITSCPFREASKELRFAFYRLRNGRIRLKYRFCPFFPRRFAHIYDLDLSGANDVIERFRSGEYHSACKECQLSLYMKESNPSEEDRKFTGESGLDAKFMS